MREFAETIWKISNLDGLPAVDAPDGERPFITPIVWAPFSAYRQVLTIPVAQLAVLRTGVGGEILRDPKPVVDLVKAALPHYSEYLDQYGTSGLSDILGELEDKILLELIQSLEDISADNKNVEQAGQILKAAEKVAATLEQKVEFPAAVQ